MDLLVGVHEMEKLKYRSSGKPKKVKTFRKKYTHLKHGLFPTPPERFFQLYNSKHYCPMEVRNRKRLIM